MATDTEHQTHAPTPWKHVTTGDKYDGVDQVRGADDKLVCCNALYYPTGISRANAAFIVRAVNCHDELLAVLKETLSDIREKRSAANFRGFMTQTDRRISAAIARAEGAR